MLDIFRDQFFLKLIGMLKGKSIIFIIIIVLLAILFQSTIDIHYPASNNNDETILQSKIDNSIIIKK